MPVPRFGRGLPPAVTATPAVLPPDTVSFDTLPPGFVLDEVAPPSGFVLDQPAAPEATFRAPAALPPIEPGLRSTASMDLMGGRALSRTPSLPPPAVQPAQPAPQLRPEFDPAQTPSLRTEAPRRIGGTATERVILETANALLSVTTQPIAQIVNFLANRAGFENETLDVLARGLTQEDIGPPQSRAEAGFRVGGRVVGTIAGFGTPGGVAGTAFKAGAKGARALLGKGAGRLAQTAVGTAGGIAATSAATGLPARLQAGESLPEAVAGAAGGAVLAPGRFTAEIVKAPFEAAKQFQAAARDDPEAFMQALEQLEPLALVAIFGVLGRAPRRRGLPARKRFFEGFKGESDAVVVEELFTNPRLRNEAITEIQSRLRESKTKDPARNQRIADDLVFRAQKAKVQGEPAKAGPTPETPRQAATREAKPRRLLATAEGQPVVPTEARIPLSQKRGDQPPAARAVEQPSRPPTAVQPSPTPVSRPSEPVIITEATRGSKPPVSRAGATEVTPPSTPTEGLTRGLTPETQVAAPTEVTEPSTPSTLLSTPPAGEVVQFGATQFVAKLPDGGFIQSGENLQSFQTAEAAQTAIDAVQPPTERKPSAQRQPRPVQGQRKAVQRPQEEAKPKTPETVAAGGEEVGRLPVRTFNSDTQSQIANTLRRLKDPSIDPVELREPTGNLVALIRDRLSSRGGVQWDLAKNLPPEQQKQLTDLRDFMVERGVAESIAFTGIPTDGILFGTPKTLPKLPSRKQPPTQPPSLPKVKAPKAGIISEGGKQLPTKLPPKKAESAAKEFERKHEVMKSTGFVPDRSPQSLGISPAGLGKLIDPKGKVTTFIDEETAAIDVNKVEKRRQKMRQKELARRLTARRRGTINLASADVRRNQKLFRKLEIADADALLNMHRAMTGNFPIEQLPKDAQVWVRHARAMHDEASERLLSELLKAHGETALTESVRHNIGRYLAETLIPKSPTADALRRTKALFGGRKVALKSEQFKFKRDRWAVAVGRSHFKFDTEQEARDAHAALLNQQLTAVIKKKALERGVSAEDLKRAAAAKKVKLVPPIPESERPKMFIRNPMVAWSISYMKTVHNAETLRYFRLIDKRFGETAPEDVKAGGDPAIAEWAKENNLARVEGNKNKVGVLHDRYLPKPIAADVNEMGRIPKTWERIYLSYLNTWKFSKTVANPPTHFRNITGNFMFADWAGNAPWNPLNLKYYIQGGQDMVAKGKAWRTLIKEGVVGSEYWGNEIKPVLKQMVEGSPPDVAIIDTAKRGADALGRLYNAEDVIFKVATYLKYVDQGMAPKVAARAVNRAFPNYAETLQVTKMLSRQPWGGPFLSFNEQAVRIAARQVRKRPLRVAYWAAFPGALTAFSVYLLGMEDDEKDLVDASRSYFEPILPFRDDNGAALTLDLRYTIALGNELQKLHDFGSGRSNRLEVPFILQQPPVAGAIDLLYNRDLFTGRDVSKRGDPFFVRAATMAKHFLRENLPIPTLAIWGRQRLQRAFGEDATESVHRAIAGALFGINVRQAYVNRNEAFERLRNLAKENPKVSRVLTRLLNEDIKSMSYKALTRSLNKDDAFQQLLDLYNTSYRYVGAPERGQDKPIKTKGVLQSLRGRVTAELKKRKKDEPKALPPIRIRRQGG